ncbi:energy-coupling factor transporter transmembrane component T family protein [Clostridium frigidicarnis]|uniref:Energy-coupling factor transport system permease protein n=1 Tax=Clostridium frigidicarnis TaxID=84698 RepID=A0A1I0W4A9_9CLOT|nr:energy-coupling factor transporter transmembrane component T [Clostridium frigidicarnis]SFA83589.1 energy-coupling factor transport system permease protein [Clostridium frigidicarnis]
MSTTMLSYIKKDSKIHNLTGATKLIFFILWTLASMLTYDTRILIGMFIVSIVIFKISKIKYKDIAFILYFILFFLLLNNIAIFIFSPYEGANIYGSKHELVHLFGSYWVTSQQMFYQFNVTIKYFSVIPMALLFMVTTDPSEFASSLNRLGVSYRISYAVSIALRYIPDIQRDYQDISFAQQARGIDMSKKEKFTTRIKNSSAILMPLIFSSLDRIDTISCAMELRAFGNGKKRTWYNSREFKKYDYIAVTIGILIFITSLCMTFKNGSRFYNPF